MIQLLYVNNIPLSSVNISCSCNFHDTISQQLHCRFRPYVSRKAATPSQSASHNPLIPYPRDARRKQNHMSTPPVQNEQRPPNNCIQIQALRRCGPDEFSDFQVSKHKPYIWAIFWLQFLGIYNFFLNLGSKQASMTKAYHSLTKPARWFAYCLKH